MLFLKYLLASSEWLNACVAIERMFNVIKGTSFNKEKSKEISKWVILIVFILTIITHIHDPLHRHLIDDFDIDEKRIWCFVRYSSSLNIYNSFITLFHFLVPFSINFISALWIIIINYFIIVCMFNLIKHFRTFKHQIHRTSTSFICTMCVNIVIFTSFDHFIFKWMYEIST